jgi:hypothetical protein
MFAMVSSTHIVRAQGECTTRPIFDDQTTREEIPLPGTGFYLRRGTLSV